jgi:chromosome segregation ATPase
MKSALLHINTTHLAESSNSKSTSSPSATVTTISSNSSSSVRSKSEAAKLNKEVTRLEALCESRTKELSMLKLDLRQALSSFDAVTVAFNYISNNLNGFEAETLRRQFNSAKVKHQEQVDSMRRDIELKERSVVELQEKLVKSVDESKSSILNLEKTIIEIKNEHRIQLSILNAEHDLLLKDLKQDRDASIKRLNHQIETMKVENEQQVFELTEQLDLKVSENAELERRVTECEEALAKDKDERIQRLLDIQRNLEREVESMKTAIDIKNTDLFDLRAKNNELTTKVDNYNELNMKLRRYKQEVEQLNAILKNKQEAER